MGPNQPIDDHGRIKQGADSQVSGMAAPGRNGSTRGDGSILDIIRRSFTYIKENSDDINLMWDDLCSCEALSEYDREEVKRRGGNIKKMEVLIKTVIFRGHAACEQFLRILNEINKSLVITIKKHAESTQSVPDTNVVLTWCVLKRHRQYLCEHVEPMDIYDGLFQEYVFCLNDHDELDTTKGRKGKVDKIIEKMGEKNTSDFNILVWIFQRTKYDKILNLLKGNRNSAHVPDGAEAAIRRKFRFVVKHVHLEITIDYLWAHNLLTANEKENIMSVGGSKHRASKLVKLMLGKGRRGCNGLLNCFHENESDFVIDELKKRSPNGEGNRRPKASLPTSCLHTHHEFLKHNLEPYDIMDSLFEKSVITTLNHDTILEKETRCGRVEALLKSIKDCSDDQFDSFVIALEDSGQIHILEELKKGPPLATVHQQPSFRVDIEEIRRKYSGRGVPNNGRLKMRIQCKRPKTITMSETLQKIDISELEDIAMKFAGMSFERLKEGSIIIYLQSLTDSAAKKLLSDEVKLKNMILEMFNRAGNSGHLSETKTDLKVEIFAKKPLSKANAEQGEHNKTVLQIMRNWNDLLDEIQPRNLISKLLRRNVLQPNKVTHQILQPSLARREKAKLLLELILRTGAVATKGLIQVLEDQGDTDVLDILTEESKDAHAEAEMVRKQILRNLTTLQEELDMRMIKETLNKCSRVSSDNQFLQANNKDRRTRWLQFLKFILLDDEYTLIFHKVMQDYGQEKLLGEEIISPEDSDTGEYVTKGKLELLSCTFRIVIQKDVFKTQTDAILPEIGTNRVSVVIEPEKDDVVNKPENEENPHQDDVVNEQEHDYVPPRDNDDPVVPSISRNPENVNMHDETPDINFPDDPVVPSISRNLQNVNIHDETPDINFPDDPVVPSISRNLQNVIIHDVTPAIHFSDAAKHTADVPKSPRSPDTGDEYTAPLAPTKPSVTKSVIHGVTDRFSKSCKAVVAAIDFGTTYSGYAFSYRDTPNHIFTGKPSEATLLSDKEPTSLLLRKNGEFDSFGVEAEKRYIDFCEENQQENFRFFSKFKMHLYLSEILTRDTELKDDNGQPYPALNVCGEAIRYMTSQVLAAVNKENPEISKDDIYWVLTVPAIWRDSDKQFMREAANYAGIKTSDLTLALEPEVAAIYAKHIQVEKTETGISAFKPGTRFLVMDLGGGTADLTPMEVMTDGTLRQLHTPEGGAWGGDYVNKEFEKLLSDLCGEIVVKKFKTAHRLPRLDMDKEFEQTKRSFKPSSGEVRVQIPVILMDLVQEINGKSMNEMINMNESLRNEVEIKGGKIRLKKEKVNELFNTVVNKITRESEDIMTSLGEVRIQYIIMVGGFSNSEIVRNKVKEAFPGITTIEPQDAGLAVVKGAVLYGHNQELVKSRVCKFTYGIEVHRFFLRDDLEEKRIIVEGNTYCKNAFHKFVEIGQHVNIGDTFTEDEITSVWPKASHMSFKVFRSIESYPRYVTDPSCTEIGKLTISLPHDVPVENRKVSVSMEFGTTEIKMSGRDNVSGRSVNVNLDFLEAHDDSLQ